MARTAEFVPLHPLERSDEAAAMKPAAGKSGTAIEPRAHPETSDRRAVRQTVRSVVIEVRPESAGILRELILDLRRVEELTSPKYERLKQAVPALHFLSMTVFEDAHYDPLFVLEINFDGEPGPFYAQVEAALGPELRAMLRCCEPPRDGTEVLFEAVVAPDSRRPLAPLLEARTVRPAVHHVGNRGLGRARILRQAELFVAAQDELGDGTRFRDADPVAIHRTLRAALEKRFPWLNQPVAPRITRAERAADGLRLFAFAALVLLGLSVPGLVLALLVPASSAIALALASIPVTVAALVLWLRWLERRDPSQEASPVNEALLRAMAAREDRVVQNHMGSVVLVKPGVLRAVLIRIGLWGLGLVLRVVATDGRLGSMRTIHFAHWALVGNGGRLMFFSNFDGSWESYLDDFIEKAHGGLTLAWGSGVGFPPARYLILDGASQGRKFKAWARHSMAESLFWFSAYPDLTVDQIERHASVAEGLCRPTLTFEEALTWTRQL